MHPHNSGICCKDRFTVMHNERGHKRHGNYINGFSVEVNIQQRVLWFYEKGLRIYYIILFECKGPSMLKTDSLIF